MTDQTQAIARMMKACKPIEAGLMAHFDPANHSDGLDITEDDLRELQAAMEALLASEEAKWRGLVVSLESPFDRSVFDPGF